MNLLGWLPGRRAEPDEQEVAEAAGTTIDDDEGQWRRITGDTKRDLAPLTHKRMQDVAAFLWDSNLLANWMIEITLAYLLGEGVRLAVNNEDAQARIDAFWDDPINKMEVKLEKLVRSLSTLGELCLPVFVNEMNGHVRYGYLDPSDIANVINDPDNATQPIGVVTKKNKKGIARRYRVIVIGPETMFSERTQEIRASFDTGDCFYFKVNDQVNSSRGRSDLLAAADWLDVYDQFLFGEAERADGLRAFLWDVTLEGADDKAVKEKAAEIRIPGSGGIRVHNQSETWNAVSPTLNAADQESTARTLRNHILGGRGLPEHWFGGGGDVNRATAGEMSEPATKMLAKRQRTLKAMLEEIGAFVIWRYRDPTGRSAPDPADPDPDLTPKAIFPELTAKDTSKYAAALGQVVSACVVMVDNGLLTEETALRIIDSVAARLGVEIDVEAELEAARKAAEKKREEDAFTPPADEEEEDADDGEASDD